MREESPETQALLVRIAAGDEHALQELLVRHRPMLRRFVELRIDAKLNARLDASDVIQEAHLEIARRIKEYLEKRPMPFHIWLHRTAYENLLRLRRVHVDAGCRSVTRESALPEESSLLLVRQLFKSDDWPGQKLVEEELRRRVQDALRQLDEIDREVLQLRTFEGLENDEVAQVLELEPGAASKRYGRALLRLRKALTRQE